jgi:hypothetical protein
MGNQQGNFIGSFETLEAGVVEDKRFRGDYRNEQM